MIDWGNTFLKCLLIDTPVAEIESIRFSKLVDADLESLDKKVIRLDSLSDLENVLPREIDLALICSVRNKADNRQLANLLKLHCHKVHFAKTATQSCGISCAYAEPEFLGIDRWLSLLAAESIAKAVGVISIGTAITLDIVINKKHLGGQIIPGKQLMFDSLFNTGQVRPELIRENEKETLLGQSTSRCVNLGIDSMIQGYLLLVLDKLSERYPIEKWLICGGGGQVWQSILRLNQKPITYQPLLIFQGLIRQYIGLKK